jgi:hypothetical protein
VAHECPECGMVCFCNGDIDDCIFDFYQDSCVHYLQCDREEDYEDDYYEAEK